MRRLVLLVLLPLLLIGQGVLMSSAASGKARLQGRGENIYALPAPILKGMALEYEGVISDYIFLRTLVYFGQTFERNERPRVHPEEWTWIRDSLSAATDIDPWFLDPYLMANSTLVWEAGLVEETNALLEKGAKYRDWDWLLPFMAGFNAHYFLSDDKQASVLLMEAARRPGASPVIATLAARLANAAEQDVNAIAFLEEMYLQTPDAISRKLIMDRLTALRDIQALSKAVGMFFEKAGHYPEHLEQLVSSGILVRIPNEPYGGYYRLEPGGRVVSSTDLGKRAE